MKSRVLISTSTQLGTGRTGRGCRADYSVARHTHSGGAECDAFLLVAS